MQAEIKAVAAAALGGNWRPQRGKPRRRCPLEYQRKLNNGKTAAVPPT
ncbi:MULTISPECIES: hypothetical protein [unclassified Micromonospora]